MKKVLRRTILLLMLLGMLEFNVGILSAEEPNPVEPNVYEEKKINIQSNQMRDNLIKKQELPEEQKGLTFELPAKKDTDFLTNQLFQTNSVKENNITAKAKQFHLFERTNEQLAVNDEIDEQNPGANKLKVLLLSIIGFLVVVLFFMIIPKLKQESVAKR
ncbi:type VII secretion protein EssA [Virgibacillus sp. W0181]|uniref:type VII secretion protein EssA n=1 Tax=Virgibacillus sp. W0181 TaxID=3391581 RepID=UPI003F46F6BE